MRRPLPPSRPAGFSLALVWVLLLGAGGCSGLGGVWPLDPSTQAAGPSLAPYVATPPDVVEAMLRLAEVGRGDVVYDLGSGDGRIVITAARFYGARGVGFEIDPDLVQRARDNARRAGVEALVEFRVQDVLTVDLAPASVVTIYLSREANQRLLPRLLATLHPGSRVVSHNFDMDAWIPVRTLPHRDETGEWHTLYLWRIPEKPH